MMARQSHFVMPTHGVRRPAFSGPSLSRFAHRGGAQYPISIAETAAIRAWNPDLQEADDRRSAVFLRPYAFARLQDQWVGLGGDGFGRAGFLLRRCSNPVMRPPTSFGTERRASTQAKGSRVMRQSTYAHTGQQSHLIQSIVRAALRNAATANTYQDALDATGAALAAIAALVRAEVRHG